MAEHLADLGWEKRKIQTLADLKREIERLGDINERVLPVQIIIETINSFEAGLRERLKHAERCLKEAVKQTDVPDDHAWSAVVFELRAILGDTHG